MAPRVSITARRLIVAAGIVAIAAAAFVGWRLYEPYHLQSEVRELGGLLEFHDHSRGPLLLSPFVEGRKSTDLILEGLPIGDSWIADHPELRRLPRLSIDLSGTRITDAGLEQLATMPEITGLTLTDTQITDSGLAGFGSLPKLMLLDLSGTPVGDQGIASLRQCERLPFLWLGTESTNASLRYLAEWKDDLQFLSLEGTQITDEDLRLLQGVPHRMLHHLVLGGPNMTDAGLMHLRPLSSISAVELRGEGFSTRHSRSLPICRSVCAPWKGQDSPMPHCRNWQELGRFLLCS